MNRKNNRKWQTGVAAAGLVAAAWLSPFSGWTMSRVAGGAEAKAAEAKVEKNENQLQEDIAVLDRMSSAFRSIARKVKPTVVQITTTVAPKAEKKQSGRSRVRPGPRVNPKDLPEPFRDFFQDFDERQTEPQPQYGMGSGVIIDAETGLILTNNHVVGAVDKADRETIRIEVSLDGGRKVHAQILGQDPKSDLALIKLRSPDLEQLKKDGVKLQAIVIGDSTKMDVGDWVLAIGAPFGLAETVTQGIISAKGRSGVGILPGMEDFLQTDAAINPGNSGGPLVNLRGELIGINTAIATSGLTRGYMGIGFAIPTDMIKQVLPDLREGREIVRGYLGVEIKGLEQDPVLAKTLGLESSQGVMIENVRPDSPAAKAGLKAEDVILAIGNTKIESAVQLQALVARTKPDTTLDLSVWREGKKISVPVKVEAQPTDFYARRNNWGEGERSPEGGGETEEVEINNVGMTVAQMTPELAKQYRWDAEKVANQVIVTEVDPLGEAAARQIKPGDIILSVQGKDVQSPAALKKMLSNSALAEGVRIRLKNQNGPRTIPLQIAPEEEK